MFRNDKQRNNNHVSQSMYITTYSNVSDNDYGYYTNDSASQMALLIPGINVASDYLVKLSTDRGGLPTIKRHDAHASEHGEPRIKAASISSERDISSMLHNYDDGNHLISTSHGILHSRISGNEYTYQYHQLIGHDDRIMYNNTDMPNSNPSADTSICEVVRVEHACGVGGDNENITVYSSFSVWGCTCMRIGDNRAWIKRTNRQRKVFDNMCPTQADNGQQVIGNPVIDYATLLRLGACCMNNVIIHQPVPDNNFDNSHRDEDTIGGNDNGGIRTLAYTNHVDIHIDMRTVIHDRTIGESYVTYTRNIECARRIGSEVILHIPHSMIKNDIKYYDIGTGSIKSGLDSDVVVCINSRIITANNSIGDIVMSIEDANVSNTMVVNNNCITTHLSDHVPDWVTNDHESMSRINSNHINTNNTHPDDGYELLEYIVTRDYGEIIEVCVYTYEFGSNDGMDVTSTYRSNNCMSDAVVRTCYRLLSAVDQYNTTSQSWSLNHDEGSTNNNMIYDDGMEHCSLFSMNVYYVAGIKTLTRRLEQNGSSHTIDTGTTHGELESRVCHSANKRGFRTTIGLWKQHVHNQLIYKMTKAYRRGVTCTGEYGFVWYLFCTLIC